MLSRQAVAVWSLSACSIIGCGDDATEPQTGAIRASLIVSGALPDADGCTILVQGSALQLLLPGESHVFGALPTGDHTVIISDLAFNCFVQGEESRSVSVTAGATTPVSFSVECPDLGSIEVRTTTAEWELDPNGYDVLVDGAVGGRIGPNDTLVVDGLAVGLHAVRLTALARPCAVRFHQPITANVLEGGVTVIDFKVDCGPCYPDLPAPVIEFAEKGRCNPEFDGCSYWFHTLNHSRYPNRLFNLTSAYGPCGLNPNPSRTWMEVYQSPAGKRTNGYCSGFLSESYLYRWRAWLPDNDPPDVYMELHDRACDIRYTSNTVAIP
ncbi:MAG: hypothetical protein WBP17_06785 [Gemmatimonadota bacterium]|jgi:hypothetical protein